MVRGAVGSTYGWGYTLYYATNFVFTGLAVAVAFQRAGSSTSAAEGQAMLGGLGTALVCLAVPWPHWAIAPALRRPRRGAVRRGLGRGAGLSPGQARQPHRDHHDHVQLHRLGAADPSARERPQGAGLHGARNRPPFRPARTCRAPRRSSALLGVEWAPLAAQRLVSAGAAVLRARVAPDLAHAAGLRDPRLRPFGAPPRATPASRPSRSP